MPFRVLAFQFGAGLATTELISSKGINSKNARAKKYLAHNSAIEKPYSVQLFGGEELYMAKAAASCVENGADIIDINMGCPVNKVTKTGAGSSLMCDIKRAQSIVQAMIKAVDSLVPITVKIRAGWDDKNINCVEFAKALQDSGAAAVALHARTRAQGYAGVANWDLIAQIKNAINIPVIGNGDVTTVAQALAMKEQTGCDGVMIGRGALGNPWIFSQLKSSLRGDSRSNLEIEHYIIKPPSEIILNHFKSHLAFHNDLAFDESVQSQQRSSHLAIRTFRSHLCWYARGYKNAAQFRAYAMQLTDKSAVEDAILNFFGNALQISQTQKSEQNDDDIDFRQAFG